MKPFGPAEGKSVTLSAKSDPCCRPCSKSAAHEETTLQSTSQTRHALTSEVREAIRKEVEESQFRQVQQSRYQWIGYTIIKEKVGEI